MRQFVEEMKHEMTMTELNTLLLRKFNPNVFHSDGPNHEEDSSDFMEVMIQNYLVEYSYIPLLEGILAKKHTGFAIIYQYDANETPEAYRQMEEYKQSMFFKDI